MATQMPAVTFPTKVIHRLRLCAAKAGHASEHGPEGWAISDVDPMGMLVLFDSLRLKKGYVLRAYQFRSMGGNGNGVVYALPTEADVPAPDDCPRLEGVFLAPPKPPTAFEDVMDAIDGDGTPWSYLCASLLRRELREFGAMWHGCSWDAYHILYNDPFEHGQDRNRKDLPRFALDEWKWVESKPTIWTPQVVMEGDTVTVTFHTYCGEGVDRIAQHLDEYRVGSYRPCRVEEKELATGPGGYKT